MSTSNIEPTLSPTSGPRADQETSFEVIELGRLLERVRSFHSEGWRLVQIGATRLPEQVELTYSFDRESRLVNLRVLLPPMDATLPSISSIYWAAFLYENELHDLFNIRVEGMAVDFGGKFYTTAVKHPFGSVKAPASAALKPAAVVSPEKHAVSSGAVPAPKVPPCT